MTACAGLRLKRSSHTDLLSALPEQTVVIDLVSYQRVEQGPKVIGAEGLRVATSYVGFVLKKNRLVERVDLGLAQPIDDAVRQWRAAIVALRPSPAPATLRRLLWEPLARDIPPETTVIIAPDGHVKSTRAIGGHPLLVQTCTDAVKEWKFFPAPEESTQVVEFDFNSSGNN